MKFLKVEKPSGDLKVKVVSLNRPELKNAFHPGMIAEVTEFFTTEAASADLVILRGEGTAFCAGADLNWMQSMVEYSFAENIEDSDRLWDMFAAVRASPAPLVGVAHGAVFGGALGLLACCDYVIAEEKTRFCFSEVKLGLAPAVITGFILPRIPDAFVRPLMISGEVFDAAEARRIGLVHQLFHGTADLESIIKTFGGNGREAMRETKNLLGILATPAGAAESRRHCTRVIAERRMSPEGQQRLQHFLNRTKTS